VIATHFRKFIFVYGLVVVFLVAGFGIFKLLNPNVGFTYYEPAYLPPGVTVKAKRIFTHKDYRRVEQNFGTDNWIYSIDEYKAGEDATIGTVSGKYDEDSEKPSCEVRKSAAGMRYRLCHWIDYGRTNVYEVKFIKDGTYVNAQIPSALNERIGKGEIDKFVDSFKEKTTIGIPVHRSTGA
jgi:hypothetical protein